MKKERLGAWFWFMADERKPLKKDQGGKWIFNFTGHDQEFAISICEKAIKEGVCQECKCADLENTTGNPIFCFYVNGDDIEGHKRLISFALKNDLVRRKASGALYNESFKFNSQTQALEYGAGFTAKIRLADFIDLNTGEWINE